ncbi:acyl-CoA dehydrogenase C-terminal domain-containing protein [Ferrimonas lipolytica]|uniref:3-methylmercaptopropionyl-CoA dehydrogenase n=1 Tax=Ferrimonas lipolytica TaxID=2724191 RepID=A0A6H1UC09_9GAMM|nr:acyl-CoA dehydrogenase family protein [Ferrimonas lipolytica]QIZ76605.1 acyl-CoA dehydrogenase [Ferrimonas lipolytica]
MTYQAPLQDMQFVLMDVFGAAEQWQSMPALADNIDADTALAILDEGAKITSELLAPINRNGDEQGVKLVDGVVITPDGFKEAYNTYAESGWAGFGGDPEFGGMGMPKSLGVLFEEMCYSANNSFTLYGALSAGAALCIHRHGTEAQKKLYLPKLYSGEWAGAMDMTEPQSGSDLGGVRTKASPQEDGSYKVSGTKIFITGGDQDLTENVVHLVLARLPDAPAGSRGLSLFIVPKFIANDDGSIGARNGVNVGALEHKMGIKASATCVMHFEEATGYLIGKANRGLIAMFTMMNYERLSISLQGIGCAEMGYQMAAEYAKDRNQGKGGVHKTDATADPIVVHGDVRRMLLTIAAMTEPSRALAVMAGMELDKSKYATAGTKEAEQMVNLLVPLCKSFFTDLGLDSTIHAQQVFGGHGFIRETGVEQLVRDVRIAQIYEGTNGIQALDLLARKVIPHEGAALKALQVQVSEVTAAVAPEYKGWADSVDSAFGRLLDAAQTIKNADNATDSVNAAAVDYLHAMGYATYGYLWLKMLNALPTSSQSQQFKQRKVAIAEFYFGRLMPRFDAHLASALAPTDVTMKLANELF